MSKEIIETESTEAVAFVFDKLEGYMSAAKSVIDTYGGDAAELGLLALRVEAASEIVRPLVLFILFAALFFYALKIAMKGFRKEFDDNSTDEAAVGAGTAISVTLGLILVFCATDIINIWAWVGIFYPEAYAVHLFLLK